MPLGVVGGLARGWRLWAARPLEFLQAAVAGGALGGAAMLVAAVALRPEAIAVGAVVGLPLGGAAAGGAAAVLVGWWRRWARRLVRRPRPAAG